MNGPEHGFKHSQRVVTDQRCEKRVIDSGELQDEPARCDLREFNGPEGLLQIIAVFKLNWDPFEGSYSDYHDAIRADASSNGVTVSDYQLVACQEGGIWTLSFCKGNHY